MQHVNAVRNNMNLTFVTEIYNKQWADYVHRQFAFRSEFKTTQNHSNKRVNAPF